MMCQATAAFGDIVFKELVITACWVIFNGKTFKLALWRHSFKKEIGLVCIMDKKKIRDLLLVWCETFL